MKSVLKKWLLIVAVFLGGAVFAVEDYYACLERVEQWLGYRYDKTSITYRSRGRELEAIDRSQKSKDEKIAELKKKFPEAFSNDPKTDNKRTQHARKIIFYASFKSSLNAESGQKTSNVSGNAVISDGCLSIDRGYVRYNNDLDNLPNGESFTVEFDLFPVRSYHPASCIIGWGGNPYASEQICLGYTNNNKIHFPGWCQSSPDMHLGINKNKWMHVEYGYRKKDRYVYIKINGKIMKKGTVYKALGPYKLQGFSIGNPYWVGGDFCAFKIRELKIYKID